jgi:L-fuculose-phosphate aldolase
MDPAQTLCDAYRRLEARGLNRGATGNLSQREGSGCLITPSGATAASLVPEALVRLDSHGAVRRGGRPSSEWPLHTAVYAARRDVNAIVHTHSPAASTLAGLRRPLPAFHYMVAIAGGRDVRCAGYALFGSEALSARALEALQGRKACLLANHGLVAVGEDLDEAVAVAEEIEALCAQYLEACAAGEPVLLSDAEMDAVIERFADYRRAPPREA